MSGALLGGRARGVRRKHLCPFSAPIMLIFALVVAVPVAIFLPPAQIYAGWRLKQFLLKPPLVDTTTCARVGSYGGARVRSGDGGPDGGGTNRGTVIDGEWKLCAIGPDSDHAEDGVGDGAVQGIAGGGGGVAFSVGIGGDFSFDRALADQAGMTVHSFDPSERHLCEHDPGGTTEGFRVHPGVTFHCIGLADESTQRQGRRMGGGHVAAWNMQTLGDLMNSYLPPDRPQRLEVLKLDCEGCEWEVLASLLFEPLPPPANVDPSSTTTKNGDDENYSPSDGRSGAAVVIDDHTNLGDGRYSWTPLPAGSSPLDRTHQLAFEIHLWPPLRHSPNSWWRHTASRTGKWNRVLTGLEERGWRRVDVPRRNPQSTEERIGWAGDSMACCWEISLINTRWPPPSSD